MTNHAVLGYLVESYVASPCLMMSYGVSWCLMMSHGDIIYLKVSHDVLGCSLRLSHGVL